MNVELHVRIVKTDRRAFAISLVEEVGDSVFHAVGNEARVAEFFAEHRGVDRESLVEFQHRFPVEDLHGFVEFVGIASDKLIDRFKDAQCGAAAEIGFIEHSFIAGEAHHTAAFFHVRRSDLSQFLSEYAFQSLEGLSNHFKFHE